MEPMEVGMSSDEDCGDTRKLVMQQNRKKKKSGGFQSMGLSYNVFKGITRKGYKIPTPIQRKCIPLVLDGKDVVAMARTGSGKTAAFLIPMFEKLKVHLSTGCRAIILSPTRELALQTLKFTKDIGKYTGLKAAVILGGDRMEDQFAAMHENPDIVIATPGRFMHVLVEMNAKLQAVEYLVFDEADRLFEMGFQEQLQEIIKRLPETRQTLLFSATLPKLLVEFARAGLHDPTLVRLDVDNKLSENLKLSFLHCRTDDRLPLLLYILHNIITPEQQTVIFVGTKHHVEYLNMILTEAGIACSYTYSALDPTARKINVAKFRNKKTSVLIVTDLAARGIDIPMLDNVINFHFPAKPKLFVHRVGRVARAGQTGTAFSFVTPDEIPFVLDLHLFLGRPMTFAPTIKKVADKDGLYGKVPQWVMDLEDENLRVWSRKADVQSMTKTITNAYLQYCRSRPAPSNESVKRMKKTDFTEIGVHPVFGTMDNKDEDARLSLLESMKSYKPNATIFEVNSTSKSQAFNIMKKKRDYHNRAIDAKLLRKQESAVSTQQNIRSDEKRNLQEMSTDVDIEEAFTTVVAPKRNSSSIFDPERKRKRKKREHTVKDEEFYVEYRPKDYQSEKGLTVGTSFENEIANAAFDLTGDDQDKLKKLNSTLKWDRKRKKFVNEGGKEANKRKIKTESGQWIAASYKTNIYQDWLGRSKAGEQADNDSDGNSDGEGQNKDRQKKRWDKRPVNNDRLQVVGGQKTGFHRKGMTDQNTGPRNKFKLKGQRGGAGLKRPEQILKQRRVTAKKESFMKHRKDTHSKKKAMFGGKGKGKKK